ncbi:hypothetical protein [Bacillus badius]|uniref:hypothetical protein n=1 Tax=Bacillus badius TaxID=1455 RepID=UPI0005979103|nr:hypothetical protein [Bacillus badius]MED4716539.1 hypothetical protein [Bacillus badius]
MRAILSVMRAKSAFMHAIAAVMRANHTDTHAGQLFLHVIGRNLYVTSILTRLVCMRDTSHWICHTMELTKTTARGNGNEDIT